MDQKAQAEYFEKKSAIMVALGFRSEGLQSLKNYVDFLWASNEDLNLISRKMTYEELIDNHLIDCLLPLKYFPKNIKRAADFGSGGGLPGVVFAIQFPEISWTLYEKSHLKQDFLNECAKISKNIKVQGDIPLELKDIHCVTARAFKSIDVLLDMSRTYYKSGGKYFLFKARKEKIDEELLLAKKKFKDLKVELTELKSPVLDVERHLVSIG